MPILLHGFENRILLKLDVNKLETLHMECLGQIFRKMTAKGHVRKDISVTDVDTSLRWKNKFEHEGCDGLGMPVKCIPSDYHTGANTALPDAS
ncbi:hypothetical protein Y032_1157g3710 [Ancylostoma ceylanicum]|uniref:Uncharacterized protein n=1 Tax=Ancylostoma ceylanicum TaxID=53326 RepID=A0A016W5J7_9BILA|nr:hypothetical protein Y032_1157g3710 [Ancylostoma ceylanicum]